MTFNPLQERGIPLEKQLRNWAELAVAPYHTRSVHPYTRCRVIAMNGIEVEAIIKQYMDYGERRMTLLNLPPAWACTLTIPGMETAAGAIA